MTRSSATRAARRPSRGFGRKSLAEILDHRRRALEAKESMAKRVGHVEDRSELAEVNLTLNRQRVRSMLDAGASVGAIVAKASEQRDLSALEALRSELAWSGVPEGVDVDVRAALRAIDQASIPLQPARAAETIRERLRLEDEWGAAQPWLDSAVLDLETGPSLGTAVAAHYAGTVAPLEDPADEDAAPDPSLATAVAASYGR